VEVGVGVTDEVGVREGEGVIDTVGVDVMLGVFVGVNVHVVDEVGVYVAECEADRVHDGVAEGEFVPEDVCVVDGDNDAVSVGEPEIVAVSVGLAVMDWVKDGEMDGVHVGVVDSETVDEVVIVPVGVRVLDLILVGVHVNEVDIEETVVNEAVRLHDEEYVCV
jgi:hypothetical protein